MTDHKIIMDRSAKEIDEAGKIARFFGFKPIICPTIEKTDIECTKDFENSFAPAEKSALLRTYFEEKMASLPQPILLYCENPFGRKETKKREKKSKKLNCTLVALGSIKSACECLSIQTAINILNAIGYKNLEVEVNSIGDKESVGEFGRRVNVFVRKNINSFSADLRQAVKKDIFAVFKEKRGGCENFDTECPKSMDFLSEQSRLHFKEVIEFLEILNVPYQINHHLIGDMDFGSETIFSIKNDGEELAFGFRFNRLGKKIGHKKDLACTTLNILAEPKKKLKKVKAKNVKPDFYLVQFGPEAKLKSFIVIQELYKAGVNVVHSIAKDKLGSQMGVAENSDIPYIILIGQKEALENSVVIRNTVTRAQEIIPIANLAEKVKKLI